MTGAFRRLPWFQASKKFHQSLGLGLFRWATKGQQAQFENLGLSVCSKNKLAFVTIWANWSFQFPQLENDDANAWEAFRCEWSQSRHNSSRAPLDDWCIQLHSVAMHQKRKWTTLCLQLRSNTKTQRTPVKREISRIGLFAQPVWGIQSSRNSFGLCGSTALWGSSALNAYCRSIHLKKSILRLPQNHLSTASIWSPKNIVGVNCHQRFVQTRRKLLVNNGCWLSFCILPKITIRHALTLGYPLNVCTGWLP